MERRSKLDQASDVLQSILGDVKSPLGSEFSRWKLWRKWPEIVGENIAKQTLPVGLRDGVLVVWVKNSVWMNQLQFVSKPMRDKINAYLGSSLVRLIRFTNDRKDVPNISEADSEILKFLENEST